MSAPLFSDRPVPGRMLGAITVIAGVAVAAGARLASPAGPWLRPALITALLIGGPAWWLRVTHTVRVDAERLRVGTPPLRRLEVALAEVARWCVIERAEAFEVRAALRGRARAALLPWLPAAAYLELEDGRVCLVGTRRPAALRAALARVIGARETVGALPVDSEPGREPATVSGGQAVTGWAALLMLGATAVFGVLVTLIVIDATRHLPGGLAVAGTVAGPVLGALVVVEAASRTPLVPVAVAALAAVCAGMAPPVAAALGGAPLTAAGLLALVTVPIAFATATMHRGRAA